MRTYTLPTGQTIDLDRVVSVGEEHINKNYPEYNCYEIYMDSGSLSYGIFSNQVSRAQFITLWSGV